MLNIEWEMKSPKSNSSNIIRNTLRDAQKQANNIIISLKRTPRPEKQCIKEINNWLDGHHSTRNIWVITKRNEIVKITSCGRKT